MSAKLALDKYFERFAAGLEREQRPRRKNGKPEIELTQAPCLLWLKINGFSMSLVQAKAVYSFAAGRYTHGQAEPGMPDAIGCTPCGLGAWIEFKAPGKRHTLKDHQYEFLKTKILKGCFAICTDSVAHLQKTWNEFEHRRKMDPTLAQNFLLRNLPQKIEIDDWLVKKTGEDYEK